MNATSALWEQAKAAEKRAWVGIVSAALILGYGLILLHEFSELESGARESVRTFGWLIALYKSFGKVGVVGGFMVVAAVSGAAGVLGVVERRKLIAQMDAKAVKAAERQERANLPAWSQVTDESGRIPARTWVWVGLLVLVLVGLYAGLKSGMIR